MLQRENLNLNNEYFNEISKIQINAKDLIDNKVGAQVLKIEVFLSKIYGDKINQPRKDIVSIGENKKIINKITEDDIGIGSNIKIICDAIDNSVFDENLEKLLR